MNFNKLCTPSYAYLIVSLIGLISISIQNLGNNHMFCMGNQKCPVHSTGLIFILQILYILFWTWLLNKLCELGYETISWFIFLLPLLFMILGLITIINKYKNNNKPNKPNKKNHYK